MYIFTPGYRNAIFPLKCAISACSSVWLWPNTFWTFSAENCIQKAKNETFEAFFPIIKKEALDERIYVKKAVNWALRNIGKRNIDLKKKAIFVANEIIQFDSKSAKWIGNNALRELEKNNVNIFDYPREMYRKSSV